MSYEAKSKIAMAKETDIIILATATAKPGKEKELEKALSDVADPTRQQKGCVDFKLFRSKENPAVIVGLERWSTEEDHNKHLQGDHVNKLLNAMADVLASPPEIVTYIILDEIR
jgi:quinol monooxygenase YgiN